MSCFQLAIISAQSLSLSLGVLGSVCTSCLVGLISVITLTSVSVISLTGGTWCPGFIYTSFPHSVLVGIIVLGLFVCWSSP